MVWGQEFFPNMVTLDAMAPSTVEVVNPAGTVSVRAKTVREQSLSASKKGVNQRV